MYELDFMGKPLKVKPVPVPKGARHPPPPYGADILPVHEFTMGIIAPKGSGKTTVIVNLLDFYKHYFHTIYVFSPTVASDEKWDYVKRQKLLTENKALERWLERQKEDTHHKNTVVAPPPPSMELRQLVEKDEYFDGKIPEDKFYSEYSETDLVELMDEQMTLVRVLKRNGQTKHLANRILIIFDDLVGSSLFSGRKDNPFKRLNTNHRHYSISMIMVTQAYKEIPKTVRTQFSCLIVFEIANEKEVEMVFEENPMGLKRDQWEEIYHYCTEGDHDFMFINYQKPKRLRIMKNFDQYVFAE